MSKVMYEQLLERLRWKENVAVINPFGEYVWLKAIILDGKQIGITDCCFVDDPCRNHQDKL